MLAAAWLHDVVEDCGISVETIRKEFNDEVAYLVEGLTDVSKPEDGNRKIRKQKDLEHLAKGNYKVHNIKLADIISNTLNICSAAEIHKEAFNFLKTYLPEKQMQIEMMDTPNLNKHLLEMASKMRCMQMQK